MGKGSNASKIAKARELAAKKKSEEGKGGGGAAGMKERMGAGLSMQCAICKAMFLSTQTESQLRMHSDSKHPKDAFEACFPDFGK